MSVSRFLKEKMRDRFLRLLILGKRCAIIRKSPINTLECGRRVYEDFKSYVNETNAHALEEVLKMQNKKNS